MTVPFWGWDTSVMKWRIGEWIACSDSDTIRREGVTHKLERRAMEALVLLCAHAGSVVKKEELIETVWGRLAVSDHSVAMVISQLRRAFGDDARAPTYIETITKRGYRLIAPCEAVIEPPTRPIAVPPIAVERAPAAFYERVKSWVVRLRAVKFASPAG